MNRKVLFLFFVLFFTVGITVRDASFLTFYFSDPNHVFDDNHNLAFLSNLIPWNFRFGSCWLPLVLEYSFKFIAQIFGIVEISPGYPLATETLRKAFLVLIANYMAKLIYLVPIYMAVAETGRKIWAQVLIMFVAAFLFSGMGRNSSDAFTNYQLKMYVNYYDYAFIGLTILTGLLFYWYPRMKLRYLLLWVAFCQLHGEQFGVLIGTAAAVFRFCTRDEREDIKAVAKEVLRILVCCGAVSIAIAASNVLITYLVNSEPLMTAGRNHWDLVNREPGVPTAILSFFFCFTLGSMVLGILCAVVDYPLRRGNPQRSWVPAKAFVSLYLGFLPCLAVAFFVSNLKGEIGRQVLPPALACFFCGAFIGGQLIRKNDAVVG